MSKVTPTDALANPIRIGDEIVYPGRSGSSLWINHAKVIDVVSEKYITQRYRLVDPKAVPFNDRYRVEDFEATRVHIIAESIPSSRKVNIVRLDRVVVIKSAE